MAGGIPPSLAEKITGPVVRAGGQFKVLCPAHPDEVPSLAIRVTSEGAALLRCHAGCDTADILAAWGLSFRDIMGDKPAPERKGNDDWTPVKDRLGNPLPPTAIYRYEAESGALLYEVVRINLPNGKKTFRQRRPDNTKSGWTWNLEGVRPVLFRLPQVVAAVAAGEEVLLVEGEKDVLTAESLGFTATTNSGGAGKFLPEMAEFFKSGAHVLIVQDADESGRRHARAVKAMIEEVGGIVRVAESPHSKDLTDHVKNKGTIEDLAIVDATEIPELGLIDLIDLVHGPEESYDWLVPGLVERGERMIITGPEGMGKSEFLRQFAICTASGIHPFEHYAMEPRRVTWFDVENSQRQNRRRFRPMLELSESFGRSIKHGQFSLFHRTEGMNLSKEEDVDWFFERLAITKPDLVVTGPWYRLFVGNPNEEDLTRKVVAALDRARARFGFALLIEAHSPHSDGFKSNKMNGVRPVRPIGSSLLLRWPEYGYGMSFRDPEPGHVPDPGDSPILPGMPDPNYCDFLAWRGARDERLWPAALRRSNDTDNWPWLACEARPMGDAYTSVKKAIERTETYPASTAAPHSGNGRSAAAADFTESRRSSGAF